MAVDGRHDDGGPAILVVDDDAMMARALGRWLAGRPVEIIRRPEEARARLHERSFRLVLCDLRMPGLTGVQLFEAVRADDPAQAARFVFMSGGADEAEFAPFLSSVDNEVLHKPFAPEALDALLARFGLTESEREP